MVKKIIAVATAFLMLCCMIPFGAFADVLDACPKCGERTYVQETGLTVDACGIGVTYNTKHCTSCRYSYYEWSLFGRTGYKEFESGVGDNLVADFISEWIIDNFGKDVRFTKFESGGGSTDGSGVGRRPDGYADDKGSALVDKDGWPTATYTMLLDGYDTSAGFDTVNKHSTSNNGSWFSQTTGSFSGSNGNLSVYGIYDSSSSNNNNVSASVSYYLIAPVSGYYTLNTTSVDVSFSVRDISGNFMYGSDYDYLFSTYYIFNKGVGLGYNNIGNLYPKSDLPSWHLSPGSNNKLYFSKGDIIFFSIYSTSYRTVRESYPYKSISIKSVAPTLTVQDLSPSQITNNNNITINKNTWNGNIYVDNSTNLTYIYPQYTTINEKNETVTNISNNPIIYNNETQKYYTYDTVTNNYYYITYEQPATPTPSPSPSPAPTETPSPSESPAPTPTSTPKPGGSISTPETGKPGGDTGDTTGILAVLVEIRDKMIQGFLDIKAAFVAGFAELSANFTLAIENLNVNIQNIFNKKFPDQSTPETAQPTPTPSPEPTETPSPTDPPSPTPSPSPAPTGKPDGGRDTNNFWNIFIGGGSDDGTDGDHKGIFWALVSLILALIAFFTNLFAGVAYLFPFLPEGVVMTINTCLFVVFLFVIIKFIMRSK